MPEGQENPGFRAKSLSFRIFSLILIFYRKWLTLSSLAFMAFQ